MTDSLAGAIGQDASGEATPGRSALRLANVTKTFPGVVALQDVDFDLDAGEVHALVGENGAGKSTLMAIAAAETVPDTGTVEISGQLVDDAAPTTARRLGLAIVHQHPAVLGDLTVTENMVLALPPEKRPHARQAQAWAAEQLARHGADVVDPRVRVQELTVEQRHLLEIAKALTHDPRVLILDEPTEPLDRPGIERLFVQVQELAERGTAIVYISHRIPEVREIASRLTVLRDGEIRGTFPVDQVTEEEIVGLIVGRKVETAFPPKAGAPAEAPVALELAAFSGDGFNDVDLRVRPGEIVGLAGIEGNGQRECMQGLAGLTGATRGTITVGGQAAKLSTPTAARKAGIAFVPNDRHRDGLAMDLSVRENLAFVALPRYSKGGFVRSGREVEAVEEQIAALGIKTPSLDTSVAALSGGNQQKVMLARALLAEPKVLLIDEPTQGVDAGARVEIYRILRSAAERGTAVVILSSDALELAGLADRVLVFSRGEVLRELERDDVTEDAIARASLTSTTLRRRGADRRTRTKLRRFAGGDYAPSVVLVAALIGLGTYTAVANDFYLSQFNFSSLLALFSALAFVALGQQAVLMAGGIDLSVGPLTGLCVVVASHFVLEDAAFGTIVAGFVLMLLTALAVGTGNGLLVRGARLSPVVATLATFIFLQGISLLLRDKPGGTINTSVIDALKTKVGFVPVSFLAVVVAGIGLELALRRTSWGLNLRAVGSNEPSARRLGIRVERAHVAAYVVCSLLTVCGALMLMTQIGVGDATAGTGYTLASITAVVLGGASILGGRGAFIGALLGAALLQQITNVTTFLNLSQAWEFWLLGSLTVAAAGVYSKTRQVLAGRS